VAVDSRFPDTAAPCVEGLKQKAPNGIELLINASRGQVLTIGGILGTVYDEVSGR
jgi:hypothetical protein